MANSFFFFQDKEAISDIVENLARLENNEELNIIQETITEDSQADQQTQVKQSLSGNPFISEANLYFEMSVSPSAR